MSARALDHGDERGEIVQFQAAFAAGGKALNQDMANYTDITPVVTISQVVA